MHSSEIYQLANAERAEAQRQLLRMFGIGEGRSAGTVEAIVDHIVKAAVLEVTAIQKQAAE